MVEVVEEWFAGVGKGFEPGCGHADALDALACKGRSIWSIILEGRDRGYKVVLPGKKRAVLGRGVEVDAHLVHLGLFNGLIDSSRARAALWGGKFRGA